MLRKFLFQLCFPMALNNFNTIGKKSGLFQKKIPGGGGKKKANGIFFYEWLVLTFFKLYGSLVFEKI